MSDRITEIKARISALGALTEEADCPCVPRDLLADVDYLLAEVARLRQGLWDCAKYAGADLDGDETPRSFVGDLVSYVVGIIKEQREQYDELLDELPLSKTNSPTPTNNKERK